jgi:hypothetical protein
MAILEYDQITHIDIWVATRRFVSLQSLGITAKPKTNDIIR